MIALFVHCYASVQIIEKNQYIESEFLFLYFIFEVDIVLKKNRLQLFRVVVCFV